MKVLVTGAGGYMGARLTAALAERGDQVVGVDRFFFGRDDLPDYPGITWHAADARHVDALPLEGVDAVVSLAALSSEGAAVAFPELAVDLNVTSRATLARRARAMGVRRFVVPSSSNVYDSAPEPLSERAVPVPTSLYAQTCLQAEQELLPLTDGAFGVVAVRQATLHGFSPKMRFDTVVNNLVRCAVRGAPLPILGDGSQMRPFLHVDDAVMTVLALLDAPHEVVAGQIFNVGNSADNLRIAEIVETIRSCLGPVEVRCYGEPDTLSHAMTCDKLAQTLNWRPRLTIADTVQTLAQVCRATPALMDDPRTERARWYMAISHTEGSPPVSAHSTDD